MKNGHALSRLMLLAAAVLFSTGGTAIKSCDLGQWQIAGFRCGVAALVLALLIPQARTGWNRWTFGVGGVYAATLVLYSLANKTTTSANAIFLQSSAPLYILVLAPLLLGERTRRRDILFMVAMAAGLVIFFVAEQPAAVTAPSPGSGNLYGAASGFFWALTVLGLRHLAATSNDEHEAVRAVVVGNLIAFVATLPAALPVTTARPEDWAWIAYLGIFQIAVAYRLLTRGIKGVPAFEASLLLLAEPIFNPIWTWWMHGETPSSGALLGGALILTAATVKTWLDTRSTG